MIRKEELSKWLENYDDIKYPSGIYDELVVDGIEHQNKIALMGAWKTGSLRVDERGMQPCGIKGTVYIANKKLSSFPFGFFCQYPSVVYFYTGVKIS